MEDSFTWLLRESLLFYQKRSYKEKRRLRVLKWTRGWRRRMMCRQRRIGRAARGLQRLGSFSQRGSDSHVSGQPPSNWATLPHLQQHQVQHTLHFLLLAVVVHPLCVLEYCLPHLIHIFGLQYSIFINVMQMHTRTHVFALVIIYDSGGYVHFI